MGRFGRDARATQRRRVDPDRMEVFAVERDRDVAGRRVEDGAVRPAAGGPQAGIPAAAADPGSRRRSLCLFRHQRRHQRRRRDTGRLDLGGAQGRLGQVDVALGEAGEQQAPPRGMTSVGARAIRRSAARQRICPPDGDG
jgi:hypothetical protein